MSGAPTVLAAPVPPGVPVAAFSPFLNARDAQSPECSKMACRHGQSTDLARNRTVERARRTGPGLWFERCPGGGTVLLRRRRVLGLLCAARGRLGVGPVSSIVVPALARLRLWRRRARARWHAGYPASSCRVRGSDPPGRYNSNS